MRMEGRSETDLWPRYKDILSIIEAALISKQTGIRFVLTFCLHDSFLIT